MSGGFFGDGGASIAEAFTRAHDDIVNASKALQQFTDISDIDQGTVDKLTKVGDSIGAMGTAIEGLRQMRDNTNWDGFIADFAGGLFSGKTDIMGAFENAKNDIAKISQSLVGFNQQLPNIPEDLPTKLQNLGTTLTGISDALNGLQTIQSLGGEKGVNFTNFVTAIQQARSSLVSVSTEIKKLDGEGSSALQAIPSELVTKIKNLTKSLTGISDSITALSNIQTATQGGANFDNFVTTIDKAKDGLVKVSQKINELSSEKGLAEIDEGLAKKLKSLGNALTGISDSITALTNIQTQTGGTIDVDGITQTIDGAKGALVNVSGKLKELSDNEAFKSINGDVAKKIKSVTSTINEVNNAITTLTKFQVQTDGTINVDGITQTIEDAKKALINVSDKLKDLNTAVDFDSAGTVEKIKNINSTVKSLTTTVGSLSAMPQYDGHAIGDKMGRAVTGVKRASTQLKKITDADAVPEIVKTVISDVSKNTTKLSTTLYTLQEVPFVDGHAIGDKMGRAVTGIKRSASQLKTINESYRVEGTVGGVISSVRSSANKVRGALTALQGLPFVDGHAIGDKVGRAVTGVKRASSQLKKIGEGDRVNDVSSIISSIKNAVTQLKSTIAGMSFQSSGQHIGKSMVSGVGTGLGSLSTTVGEKVAQAGGVSQATTAGTTLATNINTAFSTGLNLVSIIDQQITAMINQINARLPEVQQASAQLNEASNSDSFGLGDIYNTVTGSSGDGMGPGGAVSSSDGVALNRGLHGAGPINDLKKSTDTMVKTLNTSVVKGGSFNPSSLNSLRNMNQSVNNNRNDGQAVNIVIGEGAIQLDARNMTTKESRQVMINALEGLDSIESVQLAPNKQ